MGEKKSISRYCPFKEMKSFLKELSVKLHAKFLFGGHLWECYTIAAQYHNRNIMKKIYTEQYSRTDIGNAYSTA
jgi:hypothetical protein